MENDLPHGAKARGYGTGLYIRVSDEARRDRTGLSERMTADMTAEQKRLIASAEIAATTRPGTFRQFAREAAQEIDGMLRDVPGLAMVAPVLGVAVVAGAAYAAARRLPLAQSYFERPTDRFIGNVDRVGDPPATPEPSLPGLAPSFAEARAIRARDIDSGRLEPLMVTDEGKAHGPWNRVQHMLDEDRGR